MTPRTDPHRPSAIEPADYDFVGFNCLPTHDAGSCQYLIGERERIERHMDRTGGKYSHHGNGGCAICGSTNMIYSALFHHRPTNMYVRTGLDCTDKLDCGEVERFRREVRAALQQKAGKGKAAALLDAAGLAKAWQVYVAVEAGAPDLPHEEVTVRDIVGRLVQYGSVSDNAVNYLRVLVDRIERRAEIQAQRAAEAEAAAPVPVVAGRMTVRGTVLTIKEPGEWDMWPTRMLVQHESGWKVFGTLPASLDDVERGAVVEFDAAVEPSPKDPKFGFFSRPTKGRKIVA
jgi:hypothetical protein